MAESLIYSTYTLLSDRKKRLQIVVVKAEVLKEGMLMSNIRVNVLSKLGIFIGLLLFIVAIIIRATEVNPVSMDVVLAAVGLAFAFVTYLLSTIARNIERVEETINRRIDDHIVAGHPIKK